jgi:hypothetical protein
MTTFGTIIESWPNAHKKDTLKRSNKKKAGLTFSLERSIRFWGATQSCVKATKQEQEQEQKVKVGPCHIFNGEVEGPIHCLIYVKGPRCPYAHHGYGAQHHIHWASGTFYLVYASLLVSLLLAFKRLLFTIIVPGLVVERIIMPPSKKKSLLTTPELVPWIPPGKPKDETFNNFAHKKNSGIYDLTASQSQAIWSTEASKKPSTDSSKWSIRWNKDGYVINCMIKGHKRGGYKRQHWQHRNTATKVRHSIVFTRWLPCCKIQYLLFILVMVAFYLVVKGNHSVKI